jgi:riboflavin kinase / FMN hydrolase
MFVFNKYKGLMPGAERALKHFMEKGIPMALATSTTASALALKSTKHQILKSKAEGGVFDTIVTGENVKNGKPSPDIFIEAMRASGVTNDPKRVIVVEDSPAGIQAALAAKMRVIAVPCPLPGGKKVDLNDFKGSSALLSCLYDLRPEMFSLPPFEDFVGEIIPITPWYAKGPVVKGFGRGSKSLGIPTANLDPSSWNAIEGGVPVQTSGIYAGWASKGDDPTVYPVALSVGWNPHFAEEDGMKRKEKAEAAAVTAVKGKGKGNVSTTTKLTESHSSDGKTLEPWLLHDFGFDFYGEELRLLVCGYIRPEAPFTTMDALIARIHEDANQTNIALGMIKGSNNEVATKKLRDLSKTYFLRPEGWGRPNRKFLLRVIYICIYLFA